VNRRITLAARPVGFPQESDFALDEVDVASPQVGEALVRILWASVDPYQRGRMSEARSYAKSLEIGDVITAVNLGEVVESKDPRFSPGDLVVGQLGWQEYATARAGMLRGVPPVLEPPTLALHAIGLTGFTAYFGLFDVGQPRPGDTVAVSGAAGAVGQIAGQLAKLAGCRTIGIAGGPEKARDLTELYRYDVAIDYKSDDVGEALRHERVDVYFDNVGGEISQAVERRLNVGARIVVCGQVSQYNAQRPEPTSPSGSAGRVPCADGGLPRLRLRTPLRRSGPQARALGGERRHPLARGRHGRPGECPSGIHRDAQRREPGQSPRQGRRTRLS